MVPSLNAKGFADTRREQDAPNHPDVDNQHGSPTEPRVVLLLVSRFDLGFSRLTGTAGGERASPMAKAIGPANRAGQKPEGNDREEDEVGFVQAAERSAMAP